MQLSQRSLRKGIAETAEEKASQRPLRKYREEIIKS
jgi:hypothetical protein